jgi:hypothetical protein
MIADYIVSRQARDSRTAEAAAWAAADALAPSLHHRRRMADDFQPIISAAMPSIEAQIRAQIVADIESAIEAHKDKIAAAAGVPRKEVARDSMVESGMRRCAAIARGES